MDGASLTPEQEKLNALKQVLPEVFAEGKVDWEKLKATFGEDINFSNERYVLNWAGKSEAFKVLQAPTTKTLVPAKDESVNFDETEHIFIEGENLEVLKVLQKSYFGKVKMIYIDPPYNTGNDSFIYPDKFSETKEEYEKRVGDKDEDGYMTKDGIFKKNSKENGQYHSNWLNMMMPRLYLAKNLLKQDGVIFVSIDDNEVHNLRLLMNEIFGEENFVSSLVWDGGRKNDSKKISVGHEYILIYTKSAEVDSEDETIWRERKDGIDKIYKVYDKLIEKYGEDFEEVNKELQSWFNSLKETDSAKKHKHYRYADNQGVYFASDLSGPDDGRKNRPRYEVIHPITKKPVTIPSRGWRWEETRMKREIELNRVHFGKDENTVPNGKVYLKENELQAFSSVFYKDRRAASGLLKTLMGEKVFDFPKDFNVIKSLINLVVRDNDIILDFFGGSGSTAEALLEYSFDQKFQCNYIVVQLPESIEEDSRAFKAGYKTIADIAKERIRRASKKIERELKYQIDDLTAIIKKLESELPTEETKAEIESLKTKIEELNNQDLGFKVLKLSDSNFKQWQQITGKDKQALEEQMKLFVDPVAKNATTENMVYELLLKSGKDLNSTIEAKDGFYAINETELILILEKANQEIIDLVIASKPQKVIALDKLFKGNDQLKTNASLQMKDAGIEFKTI
ncbi:site-specific DNA-methyltransferase [Maribacter polysaccharolyticus]|uniref:site-specific DNA-methyltransferase n=1 Tax=Maribacter polysaccharolyticus TaxID=3020831 RepID=UPI00237F5960|nr:site-specific DNA-methyltransferase [Maribacter polysaccharolyticus]MDE3742119.1 site-specific DNA-methyltransferase [Maribacter polysaccharolyticus]